MKSPLVSIITPTYNHERYILDCIKSVQSQTFPNWEMIIVNDGSTDKTAEIAESFIKEDPRIQLINQENIGIFRLSESYNKALSLSKGKYISVLEGDDLWVAEKIERQVNVLENNDNIILAWGKTDKLSNDLSTSIGYNPDMSPDKVKFYCNKPVGSFLNLLLLKNHIPSLTITIRKEALLNIGGFQQGFNLPTVDIPTLLKLAVVGEFYFDERLLSKWRISNNQVTKTYPVELIKGQFDLSLFHYEHLPKGISPNIYITKREIINHFNTLIQIAYARSGRYKLMRQQYSEARKDYIKAIFFKGFRNIAWRLRAIIGYIFSFFRKDVEGISKLLGKDSYK